MPTRVSNPQLDSLVVSLADRYTVEREIGRGSAATVYLAHDAKHGRPVALKVLTGELSAELGTERFLREIRLLARLQHPHILSLYDSGEHHGTLYYVMPFVEGESLRDKLSRVGRLSLADSMQLVCEVSEALAFAHRQGVVHRDVKPENILLQGGHAVVADFGIARPIIRASGERTTAAGLTLGTPRYMSPEQACGEPNIDGRSDIYSLGVVLYEMLTGAAPFAGRSTRAILAQRFAPVPVRLNLADVPPGVEKVIKTALAVQPAGRYASATDFSDALQAAGTPKTRWWRRWLER